MKRAAPPGPTPPPDKKAHTSSTALKSAGAADAKGAGSSNKMLNSVEEVLAALPRTPLVGAAAPPREAASLESLTARPMLTAPLGKPSPKVGPVPLKSRPSFSAEPPSLDLGSMGVMQSPALLPNNGMMPMALEQFKLESPQLGRCAPR